jgi:D-xylose transport system permease protein
MGPLFVTFLILWFPVQDLVASLLHAHSIGAASYVAVLRNLLTCLFAAIAFLRAPLPRQIRLSMMVYCSMVLAYSVVGLAAGVEWRIVMESAGVMWLPVLAVLVGYYCHPDVWTLRRSCWLLIVMAVLSTAFGFWEIQNTWFWTENVQISSYDTDVKRILIGYDPYTGLPGNFFDFTFERRAAGLLAAPLAEGSFTTIAALVALSLGRTSSLGFTGGAALAAFCALGAYQSRTRGAMLMGLLALLGYVAFAARSRRRYFANLLFLLTVLLVVGGPLLTIASYTANLRDGSALLHLLALASNVINIGSVALFGGGVGTHGVYAGQKALIFTEGGEGAIFGIAYQLGVPGALMFMWFYLSLLLRLLKGIRFGRTVGELSCALAGLWLGALVTFPTSDHILTFSGMVGFWLLLGGTLRAITGSEAQEKRLAEYQHAA